MKDIIEWIQGKKSSLLIDSLYFIKTGWDVEKKTDGFSTEGKDIESARLAKT